MEVKQPVRPHRVELNARRTVILSGITDVRSFDEQEILVETGSELLVIRGQQLHVDRLTLEKGEADITGTIDSLVYTELKSLKKSKESLVRKLFG